MEPIYIVAGQMRSCTTMTVGAIAAGSDLEPIYTEGRAERLAARCDDEDYTLNRGKLWELEPCPACRKEILVRLNTNEDAAEIRCEREDCSMHVQTYPEQYAGRLAKIIVSVPAWTFPDSMNYKAVFLLREYEEIRQSCGNGLGGEYPYSLPQYCTMLLRCFMDARRKGVDARIVWARDLVERPLHEFGLLAQDGWPINPSRTAAHVRPESFRCRVEELEMGMVAAQ